MKKINNVNLKNKMLQKEMQMLKVKISENPEFTPKEQIVCSKSLCARSHTQEKLNFQELDKRDTLSDTLAVAVSVCLYLFLVVFFKCHIIIHVNVLIEKKHSFDPD